MFPKINVLGISTGSMTVFGGQIMVNFEFRKVALAAILCAAMAPLSMATPIGNISITNSLGGGVIGSNNLLDFFNPVGTGFGDFLTGGGQLTYNNGVSNVVLNAANDSFGQIKDLPTAVFPSVIGGTPFADFIAWYVQGTHNINVDGSGTLQTWPRFDLASAGPPAAIDCATNPGVNIACSIHVANSVIGAYISPLVLTQNASGGSSARLDLGLIGRDATGSAPFKGLITAQIADLTPAQIANLINTNQNVNVTSWSADITAVVPEPSALAMALAGAGMIGLGILRRRR